jgi:hypothetical protein
MAISFRCDRERLQRFKGEEGKGRCPSTGTRLCEGTPSFDIVIFREVGKQQEKGHLKKKDSISKIRTKYSQK